MNIKRGALCQEKFSGIQARTAEARRWDCGVLALWALPLADFAKGGVFRPLVFLTFSFKFSIVPWSLKRFQQSRQLHYITFSCYRRQPRLNTPQACRLFLRQLEIARRRFAMCVYGYVVMPEHGICL